MSADSVPPPLATPIAGRERATRRSARLVAAALRAGRPSANDAFDRFLPTELRQVADQYWTPLPVVRRVATWLRETGVGSVLDIGSGAGKFCVAAALLTRCRFTGVEHRSTLVAAARDLAAVFEVDARVSFVYGTVNAVAALPADAVYIFNPFGEYTFDDPRFIEEEVIFTPETRQRDVAAVAGLLSGARAGTFVVTYNGFGGPLPAGYEELDSATRLPGTLRLWKKLAGDARQNPIDTAADTTTKV